MGQYSQKGDRAANGAAMFGIIIVIIFLLGAFFIRGKELRTRNLNYQAVEESLAAEIEEETHKKTELEEQKKYVKSKDYIREKAREIFGLTMPDEIIVKPGE